MNMISPEAFPKNQPKVMNAWAFYDWANSVYSLVIGSTIFPIFWSVLVKKNGSEFINFLGFKLDNESLITYVTSAGFLVVVLITPILSGVADYTGLKKRFLRFFCYLGAISCVGMYWFDSIDHVYYGLTCYFFALIGFWCSVAFYNSYLPDIATVDKQDSISAKGFSLGFLGSTILLVFNLWMLFSQGDDKAGAFEMMKYSFITVGLWWVVFSLYTFKHIPNFKNGKKINKDIVWNGYKELLGIWKLIKSNPLLKKYLGAFFSYSMAVQTIMIVATYFGINEIDWGGKDPKSGLIMSILLINLIAIPGALGTSRLAKSIGNIKALVLVNAIWLVVCVYAYTIHKPVEFYITAAFVGLVMGGVQSLSRSTYSKLLPENTVDTTSFFSFYDVTEKLGIIIGTFLYGFIKHQTGSARLTIIFFSLFFLIGIILLYRLIKSSRLQ